MQTNRGLTVDDVLDDEVVILFAMVIGCGLPEPDTIKDFKRFLKQAALDGNVAVVNRSFVIENFPRYINHLHTFKKTAITG